MNTTARICHVFVGLFCRVLLIRVVADEPSGGKKAKGKTVGAAATEKGKKQETRKDSTPDSTERKGKKGKTEQETAADASVEQKTFDKSIDDFMNSLQAPTENIEIGEEIDVTLKYKFSKHITFLTGYSHLFPDKLASDTGTDDGIDWFFV